MMRRSALLALLPVALLSAACASGGSLPATSAPPERILLTGPDGTIIRQATTDANAHMNFAGPFDKVWAAVQSSYADLGVEANFADRATGKYGAMNYIFPRRLLGQPIGGFFSCGSSMVGPLVDQGRLSTDVITTLSAGENGTTEGVIYVNAVLRKSEGASSDPTTCTSTGRLEESLRTTIQRKLATP